MNKKFIALMAIVCVVCCALCLVACNKDNVVEVTSVEFDITQIELTRGEGLILNATITPSNASNQTIEWTSANHSVAIVESGYVVTFGEGTTIITAKSNNGKNATCKVTVKANDYDNQILTVKFDPNGGKFADGKTEPIEKTVNWGDRLDPMTVTRDGKYEFEGWYIKGRPATGAWNFDAYGVYDDITLYAKWDYINDYDILEFIFASIIQNNYKEDGLEDVEVDIISVYVSDDGYFCFIEKDRYGASAYKTNLPFTEDILTLDILKEFIQNYNLTEIDSYSYYYNSDNYFYIANSLPIKYTDSEYSVVYACVTDWVYDSDASHNTTTTGPWYSCKVKALMLDEDGKVFTYSATVVSATTNFNLVIGGGFLSEAYDEVITYLGDFANVYYAEYLLDKEADILY